jgi:uncharacterized protein (TIGR03437 family)
VKTARAALALLSLIAILSAPRQLSAQTPRRLLIVDQSHYSVVAGERVSIQAPPETLEFMRSARTRIARASGASSRTLPVGPDVEGNQILLGVPLTTRPGEYSVDLSFVNDAGEERGRTLKMTVAPFATATAGSAVPPVVLLDGWQFSLTNSCPMSSSSTGNFDNLQSYLVGSPNFVPIVYFFENCTECPNCSIEQLGADLGTFLNSLPVPQVDVIAHSMGGLIVRAYLSGKQAASGSFSPPATPKIRKAVFIATPHFGSFQADSLFVAGTQTDEMKRGSQFAWDLGTWNQFGDDLRGVDAVAVIGNAGPSQQNDGVVGLTSASLDFASPGRTRVINYCHIPPGGELGLAGIYLGCEEPGIAYVDSPSHQTYEIVSSFLLSASGWQTIGNAPAQDQYLSKYGGMVVADVSASDQFVSGLSGVSWGSVSLTNGAASGELFYNDLVSGTASFSFGSSTCGPYTETAGVYARVRCKAGPSISSVGPLLTATGKVVQAGTAITINGTGFGAQQCSACQVTAANPQSTVLQIDSWTDTAIKAFLPASYGVGMVTIGVVAAGGSDATNIMAGTVASPPAISLVANAEGEAPTIAPNTWVEIKGLNLAPPGVSSSDCAPGYCWQPSDFVNNQMPTQLAGVSVTVNGKSAYVYYISPTQINILTPPDALPSSVQVQVSNNGTPSASYTVQAQTLSPSFFVFNGGPYVAATHLNGSLCTAPISGACLVGPSTLYPGSSAPAQPGEIIVLYANGFGPTSVPVMSGAVTQSGTLTPLAVIKIGGVEAIVQFAGLSAVGEFQFNVVVPLTTPDGDQTITATYNGATTQAGMLITVQQ